MNTRIGFCCTGLLFLAACSSTPQKPAAPDPVRVANTPVVAPVVAPITPIDDADILTRKQLFVTATSKQYGIPEAMISEWLSKAQYKQSIVNAMSRPAEATKTWAQYRPIFITENRIALGKNFYNSNRADVDAIAQKTGVPSEIILAIMGVETGWGNNMGSHNVLDALYTLAFYYPVINNKPNPARAAFFTDELGQFFALCQEEKFDVLSVKGSYAGAMGLGQFMPSSYRHYAKDGDGDGKRDIFTSNKDAYASIANYFIAYGWQNGKPVVARAKALPEAQPYKPENWEAKFSLAEMQSKAYLPFNTAQDLPLTLLSLDGAFGLEYWFTYKNFWVITRYNRSPMYALAVFQLAQEIAGHEYDKPIAPVINAEVSSPATNAQ